MPLPAIQTLLECQKLLKKIPASEFKDPLIVSETMNELAIAFYWVGKVQHAVASSQEAVRHSSQFLEKGHDIIRKYG